MTTSICLLAVAAAFCIGVLGAPLCLGIYYIVHTLFRKTDQPKDYQDK